MKNRPLKSDHDDQRARFIEAAREAGCSEDEAEFDAKLTKIAKAKPSDEKRSAKK